MKTIEIIISPQGETKLEAKNFSGTDCQLATKSLEMALGCRISKSLSPEYFSNYTNSQSEVRLKDA